MESVCHSERYTKYMFNEVMEPTKFFEVMYNFFENYTAVNQLAWSMVISLNDGIDAEKMGKDLGLMTRYMLGIELDK